MTCKKISDNCIICYSNIDFEFRFLLWRCEFVDKMYYGPMWYLSIPRFELTRFIQDRKRFGKKLCPIKEYFTCYEKEDLILGEHNILWVVFNYHFNKYQKRKNK